MSHALLTKCSTMLRRLCTCFASWQELHRFICILHQRHLTRVAATNKQSSKSIRGTDLINLNPDIFILCVIGWAVTSPLHFILTVKRMMVCPVHSMLQSRKAREIFLSL